MSPLRGVQPLRSTERDNVMVMGRPSMPTAGVDEPADESCAVADELELQACVLQLMRLTGMAYEVVAAGLQQAVSVSPHDFRTVTDQLVHGIIRIDAERASGRRDAGILAESIAAELPPET
jgi:hypothetical protein